MLGGLLLENRLREKCRDRYVGKVDSVTDLQIDGNAADNVRLFPAPATLLQQFDHIDEGVT